MVQKEELTFELLRKEARAFSDMESKHDEPCLYGITDGKAVGTYLEHKFKDHLRSKYHYESGNSAEGIDFPKLLVDIKVTSIKQPQSSCPFKSARQKIFGLGYGLLVFVYEKVDDKAKNTARLNILHTIFVEKSRTADFQITSQIKKILDNKGNVDDLIALITDKNLPVDEIEAHKIAEDIIKTPPTIGYLTISNALQWRLQYSRIIEEADKVSGVIRVK